MARLRTGFTTRASCLLAAGLTAGLCGLLLGEVDLLRAGVLAAAVPFVAATVVHRSQVRISSRRSVEPPRATAGDAVTVHLTISNRSVLRTGALMLEDQLPDRLVGQARFVLHGLGSHASRTVSYRMPNLGRGRYLAGPLRIRLSDPFGMVDFTRSFTTTTEFVVTPVVDPLSAVEPPRSRDIGENAGSHSIGAHGADDASTRVYRIGDDLRKIHWRSSARTGALMVRQEERPWQGQSTLLLDLRAGGHAEMPQAAAETLDPVDVADPRLRSSLEWAVSAAASIGSNLMLARREVGLFCDPAVTIRLRLTDPTALVTQLATVRAVNRPDLTPFTAPLRSAARDSVIIGVLGRLDAASLRALTEAYPRGRSAPAFAMLLDVDSWYDPMAGIGGNGARRRGRSAADAAANVLHNAGWRVTVVRRGDSTAHAWQTLLGSYSPKPLPATVLT